MPGHEERGVVLVVEDDEHVRRLLAAVLRRGGYVAVAVPDAAGAVAAARENRPDAVVLDLLLPGGGGIGAIAAVRSACGRVDLPVIVVSGLDSEVYGPRALAAGATAYLGKPVGCGELLAALELALLEPDANAGAVRSRRERDAPQIA